MVTKATEKTKKESTQLPISTLYAVSGVVVTVGMMVIKGTATVVNKTVALLFEVM